MKYAINAVGVPAPMGPYSQGTTAGRLVFVTGQIAVSAEDPKKLIDGGIEEQATRVIHLAQSILAEAGCTLSDVAQTTIYLADINELLMSKRMDCFKRKQTSKKNYRMYRWDHNQICRYFFS